MAAPLVHITPSFRTPGPTAERKPAWLKVKAPGGPNYVALKQMMRGWKLHTVCEEAHCPNIGECWEHRAATFMILGDVCTRNCAYCAVAHGTPAPLDLDEPVRLAEAVGRLELEHVVITSVDRDDLPNGGAELFAQCIAAIRTRSPETSVEILIPDFNGSETALRIVVDAKPDILNHNLETIARLYRLSRPGSRYPRALELRRRAPSAPRGSTSSTSASICVPPRDTSRSRATTLPTSSPSSNGSASRWATATWSRGRSCARATTRGSRSSAPWPRYSVERLDDHRHRPRLQGRRPGRAAATHAAPDAPDPPLRGEGRRVIRPRQDRRLLPSLHRPGGRGGLLARRAARRRLRHQLLSRARPGARPGHPRHRGHGGAVRQ